MIELLISEDSAEVVDGTPNLVQLGLAYAPDGEVAAVSIDTLEIACLDGPDVDEAHRFNNTNPTRYLR